MWYCGFHCYNPILSRTRYLKSVTCSIILSFITIFTVCMRFPHIVIDLVFVLDTVILYFLAIRFRWFTIVCRPSSDVAIKIWSSAYSIMFTNFLLFSCISSFITILNSWIILLLYILKNTGERPHPCFTPKKVQRSLWSQGLYRCTYVKPINPEKNQPQQQRRLGQIILFPRPRRLRLRDHWARQQKL